MFSASRRIEWYTFWPWGHVKVTWPEVTSWPWPYEVIRYIFRCVLTRGSRWCSLFCSSSFSSKVINKKTPLLSGAAILTFLTPVTSFLTWPKSDLSKNCRARPSVSNAVYRLSLACFVFDISGGRLSAPPVGTKVARTPVGARVNISCNFQSVRSSIGMYSGSESDAVSKL